MANTLSPLQQIVTQIVPEAAQAADATTTLFVAPFAGTITNLYYVTDTAITGADTHTRKVALVNKGQAGLGTTEMAAKQFNLGTDAVAFAPTVITLSGTAANKVMAANDVIAWASTKVGNGLADPGGTVTVVFTRS